MTYSYSSPVSYGPQQNDVYYTNTMPKKHFSAGNAMTTGVVLGGLAGTVVGATKKNYVNKDGSFSDSFVKSTFENYINNSEESSKKAYTEGLEILKKIDSVKTPEELKALFDANPEAAEEIFNELKQTPDDFLNKIRKGNLNRNKKAIKSKINAGNNTRYQDIKNQIELCWDTNKKKFVKDENVEEAVFNAINKSKSKIQWRTIGKFAALGAVAAGLAGFVFAKIFNKQSSVV